MGTTPGVADIDMKLEVVVIPVSDVARAEEFYGRLGWRSDQTPPGSGVVQLTPHGSACSVHFGTNLTTAAPGSARSFLIVPDIEQVHDALVAAGVQVSDVFHLGPDGPVKGPDPDRGTYRSRAEFADPDGNTWVLQEITNRLPGRVDPGATAFNSATDLATAMRRASQAHGEHEKRIGGADPDWPDWYAAYMVAEASGAPLPQ
ncbi:VOC family protein [Catellatospora citrea]|uniref:Glyoxalase n=1 Tax=Catellatospora citrea TaxID=53366 RepID=A0A8J3KDR4_9ACTN|nr:VOC family protein [Catellatospora citrea]RKE05261.1 catechol 2,3-dioxygenase-like lactoylglutathione lyase family enzyme [Catellatospora citrea]GIF98191.1 glyoxalase [Catellatospora citrea]